MQRMPSVHATLWPGLILLLGAFLANEVRSATHVIDFDNLKPDTDAKNLWYNSGVTFDAARIIAPAKAKNPLDRALTAGGPFASKEFHSGPLVIKFKGGQSYIKMAIGLDAKTPDKPVAKTIQFTAKAFDKNGKLVAKVESKPPGKALPQEMPLGPGPTPIDQYIELKSTASNIYRVELQYESLYFEVIDDLQFDNVIAPPPDTQPPVVTIAKPTAGSMVSSDLFPLEGSVQEDVDLKELKLTIESPGKAPASFPIDHGTPPSFTFQGIFGLLQVGDNTIRVNAKDVGDNVGEDSVKVTYTPPPPKPLPTLDLYPSGVEITQGTVWWPLPLPNPPQGGGYDYYTGLKLVSGKRTVVRVYGKAENVTGPVYNVFCELTGTRNGILLSKNPLRALPERIGIDPSQNLKDQRTNVSLTWNFVLPHSWTQKGAISLVAHVNPGGKGNLEECGTCYNLCFPNIHVRYDHAANRS